MMPFLPTHISKIPDDVRLSIDSIDTAGRMCSWCEIECRISLTSEPFRLPTDPLMAEALPRSLAHLLAVASGVHFQFPVRLPTLSWAVVRFDVTMIAPHGLIEMDLEFGAEAVTGGRGPRLIDGLANGSRSRELTLPQPLTRLFHDLLQPMYSVANPGLTGMSPS